MLDRFDYMQLASVSGVCVCMRVSNLSVFSSGVYVTCPHGVISGFLCPGIGVCVSVSKLLRFVHTYTH